MELKQYRITKKDGIKSAHSMALHLFHTQKYPGNFEWEPLMMGICRVRGKSFSWGKPPATSDTPRIREWLKSTPVLKDWVMSDDCLNSPRDWPHEIYPAFKHSLIPSPHELANVKTFAKIRGNGPELRAYYTVMLYAMGLPLDKIAEATQASQKSVLTTMANGIQLLNECPQYLLWATGTDFSRAVFPVNIMRQPLKVRAPMVAQLKENPFSLTKEAAQQFLANPSYFSYLIFGSPKQMRLTKTSRVYRTGER
tara:strand:+ start:939 stop:1697 length:759 start_codon:yes stop_codon:yes gene_type:complete